jgi:hypothetical protein
MSDRDQVFAGGGLLPAAPRAPRARLAQLWRRATRYVERNERIETLRALLHPLPNRRTQRAAPVVAVQCVESALYFGLFAALCEQMRSEAATTVELVVVRSINAAVGNALLHTVAR